jgi:hypothetical protein
MRAEVAALALTTLLSAGPARGEPASVGVGVMLLDPVFNDTAEDDWGHVATLKHSPDPFLLIGEVPLGETTVLVLRGAFNHRHWTQAELEALNGSEPANTVRGGADIYRAGLGAGPRWRFWGNDWLSTSLYGMLAWDVRHAVHAFTYRQPRIRVEARRIMNAVSATLGCALDVPVAGGVHARLWLDVLDARYAWGGHTRDVDLEAPGERRVNHVMLSADLTAALELAYAF